MVGRVSCPIIYPMRREIAITMQQILTYGDSRSPIRAAFQNTPRKPCLCLSIKAGKTLRVYAHVQMKRRITRRRDWKLKSADILLLFREKMVGENRTRVRDHNTVPVMVPVRVPFIWHVWRRVLRCCRRLVWPCSRDCSGVASSPQFQISCRSVTQHTPTVLIARPDSPKFALWNREPKALEGAHGLKGASLSSPRI